MADSRSFTPTLPIGSARCQCSGCARYFSSVASFDAHRVGEGDARHCLTEAAMLARGMGVNDKGYWVTKLWEGGAFPKGEAA